jgi:2-dehydro-3-deoxyphosphogluconate aldolase/(4S)-4-hydroxy-2-oxoglutarate aldolase
VTKNPAQIAHRLHATGVIPVVALSDVDSGLRLMDVLATEGLPAIEVTFRTPVAAEAIAALRRRFPDVLIAAGTVLSADDARRAAAAGADVGVAPGLRPAVLDTAVQEGLPFVPGIATASEAGAALERGLTLVKLFPAEVVGGVALIDALAGPLPQLSFMPTGGIREERLGDYLSRRQVAACGGTWIAPSSLLDSADFAEISRRARSAVAAVRAARPAPTTSPLTQTGAAR